jgi:hypothetical protein
MLVAQALENNSCGGVGVCFFLSFFGFLGRLFYLVLAQFFIANISEMNICVERSWLSLFFALILTFSCCLTLSRRGDFCWFGFVWGLNACRRMFVEDFLPGTK